MWGKLKVEESYREKVLVIIEISYLFLLKFKYLDLCIPIKKPAFSNLKKAGIKYIANVLVGLKF